MELFGTTGQSRRKWLDETNNDFVEGLKYYLGPQLFPKVAGLLQGAAMLNPAADVVGAGDSSRDAYEAFRGGDMLGGVAQTGMVAAGLLGMAVPGTARSVAEGIDSFVKDEAGNVKLGIDGEPEGEIDLDLDELLKWADEAYKNEPKVSPYAVPKPYVTANGWEGQQKLMFEDLEPVDSFAATQQRAKDLGFVEPQFHYTRSGQVFDFFDANRGVATSELPFDALGPHTGTQRAAYQRGDAFRDVAGYTIPLLGRADTPLTPSAMSDVGLLNDVRGAMSNMGSGVWSDAADYSHFQDYAQRPRWSENALSDMTKMFSMEAYDPRYIDSNYREFGPAEARDMFDSMSAGERNTAVALARRGMADAGYTHIPYANAIEDAGSTSNIWLVDRKPDDRAVLRSVFARFNPQKINNPNLMYSVAPVGAIGVSSLLEEARRRNEQERERRQ